MTDLHSLWQECLTQLRGQVPAVQYSTWLKPLSCQWAPPKSLFAEEEAQALGEEPTKAEVIISANARKVVHYVEENFWEKIVAFFNQHGIHQLVLQQKRAVMAERSIAWGAPNLKESTTSDLNTPNAAPRAQTFSESTEPTGRRAYSSTHSPTTEHAINATIMNGHRSHNGLQPHYCFDSFIIGKSNQLAHSAALQVSEKPGVAYNPFYLYGGVGLGKTHLAHAIGNALIQKRGYRVRYIHADDYFNEVAKAVRHNAYEQFKQEFRSLDAIIIDDVQFLQNRERTQEELFYLFNTLMETGRQVIVTSDRYPRDIEKMQERLRSRFQWGLTVAIEPPEIELRVAILQDKAERDHIALDTPSAYYIARHMKSNVRELEGALTKIQAYTQCHAMPINADTVRLALKDIVGQVATPLSVEVIQKAVCEFCKVRPADMHAKNRTRDIAAARQMAMWLTRELTTLSLPQIGEAFGGRDHTTVLHACKTIEGLKQKNPDIHQRLRILEQMLRGD